MKVLIRNIEGRKGKKGDCNLKFMRSESLGTIKRNDCSFLSTSLSGLLGGGSLGGGLLGHLLDSLLGGGGLLGDLLGGSLGGGFLGGGGSGAGYRKRKK